MSDDIFSKFEEPLHKAICAAFDPDTLEQLLRFRLTVDINEIAPNRANFKVAAFQVIVWAGRKGRLVELARAAADVASGRTEFPAIVAGIEQELAAEAAAAERRQARRAGFAEPLPESLPVSRRIPLHDEIKAFIRGYERLRQLMPEGAERIALMDQLANKLRAIPLEDYDLLEDFHLSDSAGERLAAITALRRQPNVMYMRWLSERIGVEEPFAAHQASLALSEAARSIAESDLDGVAVAIAESRRLASTASLPGVVGATLDEARKRISDRITA